MSPSALGIEALPESRCRLLRIMHSIRAAFQIIDDILDFEGDPSALVTPIAQPVMTGPLLAIILYAEKNPEDSIISAIIREQSQDHVPAAVEKVRASGSKDECKTIAKISRKRPAFHWINCG
jgi:geranylgeranyl pyrophosphate synthase